MEGSMAISRLEHGKPDHREAKHGISRTSVNLLVDLAAAALFLGMMATGYILWFTLPPGTNKSLSLWQLTRHEWGTVHAWISFGLIGALLLHLVLHWQWVVSVVRKRFGARPPRRLDSGAVDWRRS